MSTRRIETPLGQVKFDHGAQYFSAQDPDFISTANDWVCKGVATEWPAAGKGALVGYPTMNAIIRHMVSQHDVEFNSLVQKIEHSDEAWQFALADRQEGPFDLVILAIPPEQALPFLALQCLHTAGQVVHARSQACWTAMFTFDEKLPIDPDILSNIGDLSRAVRNSAKPGRGGPESWVLQANPEWSLANIDAERGKVEQSLLSSLESSFGVKLPPPIASSSHRWRFASTYGLGSGAVWIPQLQLGICGDWMLGADVECAWLSGVMLAKKIVAQDLEDAVF